MSDIVERLCDPRFYGQGMELSLEAAAEIRQLRAEKAEQEREWAELCAERERPLRAEVERLRAELDLERDYGHLSGENKRLRALVQTLIDGDPNELAADGGVTVLDVWRKEARHILENARKER